MYNEWITAGYQSVFKYTTRERRNLVHQVSSKARTGNFTTS